MKTQYYYKTIDVGEPREPLPLPEGMDGSLASGIERARDVLAATTARACCVYTRKNEALDWPAGYELVAIVIKRPAASGRRIPFAQLCGRARRLPIGEERKISA